MKIIPRLVSCLLAVSALGVPAAAQSPPVQIERSAPSGPPQAAQRITLAAAVDAAWQRAVAAREAQGQLQRADAGRAVGASLWAAPPSLEVGLRDDRWMSNVGDREAAVALAWPLWLPGQRQARNAADDAGVAVADETLRAVRLRIAGEVRETAWSLAAQQAEATLADASVGLLSALADDVERRVGAGDLARADALAARAEWLAAMTLQSEAQQRLLHARTRWTLLTGLDGPVRAEETAAAPAPMSDALASHPDLRLASAAAEHARKRLALLDVSRRDAPELTFGVRQEVAARGQSAQYSAIVGLRLPLGTTDRNRPLQAAALADLDVAQASEQRLRERLAAELTSAQAGLQQAERQLEAERSRAELLRERAQLIDKSFRAGESPLPDLLRALAAATQADAAAARQYAALGLARARLQQALGILP